MSYLITRLCRTGMAGAIAEIDGSVTELGTVAKDTVIDARILVLTQVNVASVARAHDVVVAI